jgi:hypothetical protein
LDTFLRRVCRRGSVTRGSLWDELEELLDELEPEGGFELAEPLGDPDFELDELEAACELEEPGVLDLELDDVDEPDLELDDPEVLLDFEPEEPDVLLDEPDVDELEDEAGLAGVPSFTAMSNGPFTPGPKYFAVRS